MIPYVRSRAPLRLGLGGGGTDVSTYIDSFGGCVLNATIDKYAYTSIGFLQDKKLQFRALDLEKSLSLSVDDDLNALTDLELHREVYNVVMDEFNDGRRLPLCVSTFCDAEAGSGLGSSSTLVVSMLQAYMELLNIPLDLYRIAEIAYQIERVNCGMNGGKQDQYSDTFGGFNFMEFHRGQKTIVNPLRLSARTICELEASLILCYTGISRDSSKIIEDQTKNITDDSGNSLAAMHKVKEQATIMKDCLLTNDFAGLSQAMREGWDNKKKSSKSVSNEYIDSIYEQALQAGATSGKISGAGGGGYLFLLAPIENRVTVSKTLKELGLPTINCHFVKQGACSWRM